MVFVNNYTRRNFIGSPFGGVKGSGYGREYAAETVREFVRAKLFCDTAQRVRQPLSFRCAIVREQPAEIGRGSRKLLSETHDELTQQRAIAVYADERCTNIERR